MRRRYSIILGITTWILVFYSQAAFAQTPQWVMAAGGASGNDQVRVCRIASNGNLYIGGRFSGTIDIDPSTGTYNLISNGNEDIYLACYTSGGTLLWGFNAGGPDNDNVYDLILDGQDNPYIVGYFKGANVDFDPSANTAFLSDVGLLPGTPAVGGDGYIAKYTSTGGFQWCRSLGANGINDLAESLCIDNGGNVYVGGIFTGIMDIDPTPGVINLTDTNGIAYVVKYTPAGQLIWGKVIGASSIWAMKVNSSGFLYLTGAYGGINSDFDASPAGTAYLYATGIYDAYLAKYDTAFNYQFAKGFGGSDLDECYNLEFDAGKNIYLSGSTLSPSLNFGPVTANVTGLGENMYLVKYDSTGQAIWGYAFGNTNNDKARAYVKDSFVYVTGYFSNTIDFDPSPAMANLTSNGGLDIFVCTYKLNGEYICGFSMGGTGNEQGVAVAFDKDGYFYLGGDFSNTVDFDPRPGGVSMATASGARDLFLGKYYLPSAAALPDGYLLGDTVCLGEQAFLQFISTSGIGPFTITYTDGVNSYTKYNVTNGTTLELDPNPLHSTTYTLLAVAEPDICNKAVNNMSKATLVLITKPEVVVSKSRDIDCKTPRVKLSANGAASYEWSPVTHLSNPYSSNPEASTTQNTTYTVIGTNEYGCKDTSSIDVYASFDIGGTIFFPDAFSPNNDGVNDCFGVKSNSIFTSYELSIYNRWGERVFYSVQPDVCWDGSYKGATQALTTFYYYYRATTDRCGEFSGKGSVHLLK
jgi:gliding motility-associated-like protein